MKQDVTPLHHDVHISYTRLDLLSKPIRDMSTYYAERRAGSTLSSLAGVHRSNGMTLVNNSVSICLAISLRYGDVSVPGHTL